jgi:hypothetical protein
MKRINVALLLLFATRSALAQNISQKTENHTETRVARTFPGDGKVIVKSFIESPEIHVYAAIVQQGPTQFPLICAYEWTNDNWFTRHKAPSCNELLVGKTYEVHKLNAPDPDASPTMLERSLGTLRIGNSSYFVATGDDAETVFEDDQVQKRQNQRKAKFTALGLHRNQPQAKVKLILLQHGFEPWHCQPAPRNANVTMCIAVRRKGTPTQDEISLFFTPISSRDEDTGKLFITDRVLLIASLTIAGESEKDSITSGPAPF